MSAECSDKNRRAEAVIQRVMASLHFDQESLCNVRTNPKSKHLLDVYGVGNFYCDSCPRQWTSAFSWITISLKSAKVTKWWKMKCFSCLQEYEPTFDDERLADMVTRAVERYQGIRSGGYKGTNKTYSKPHNSVLCEKCGYDQCQRYCFAFINPGMYGPGQVYYYTTM